MKIKDLLEESTRSFYTLKGNKTVEQALKIMSGYKVSAIVVKGEDSSQGIFTERDLVRCYLLFPDRDITTIPIKEVMTSKLIVVEQEETIHDAMGMMIKASIRHLPVVNKGEILGMLCLEDLVKKHVGALTQELHYLKDYISDLQEAAHD
jgi:signal-transduction protein with cAMP-binding, CBS, and nucleotidyltransferase domain